MEAGVVRVLGGHWQHLPIHVRARVESRTNQIAALTGWNIWGMG